MLIKMLSLPRWPFIIVGLWIYLIGLGEITGRIAPVVVDVEISAVSDPVRDDWVFVSGGFYKVRNACNPLRMEWFLGERGDAWVPVAYVWGKPEVRHDGFHTFYDWRVRAAPPAVLLAGTYSDVIHQCGITINFFENHWRLDFPWETSTPFWGK